MITRTADRGSQRLRSGLRPSEEVCRHQRMLLGRLDWPGAMRLRGSRTLGLTSSRSGEGVSTIAAQLAATAAAGDGRRVLLVEANFARPSLHRIFSLAAAAGLSEALFDGEDPAAAVQISPVENLSVLVAGRSKGRMARAADPGQLAALIKELQNDFDLLVFDMPPAGQAGGALRLAGLLDGVLLVVEAERTTWEVARRTSELLRRADVQLLGAVLNKVARDASPRGY